MQITIAPWATVPVTLIILALILTLSGYIARKGKPSFSSSGYLSFPNMTGALRFLIAIILLFIAAAFSAGYYFK